MNLQRYTEKIKEKKSDLEVQEIFQPIAANPIFTKTAQDFKMLPSINDRSPNISKIF